MKILIPIDFSANADHALNYAALGGKAIKANLILLAVYAPPMTRGTYPLITEEIGRTMNAAMQRLHTI